MHIAICDTDTAFTQYLKHKIYFYSNRYKLDLVIDIFISGEDLLESGQKYSLIFLEYSLLGINGLETAKHLRKSNINSKIIFISQNTDFIFEVFSVSPFRFLKKPISEAALYETLNDYFSENNTHHTLWINDGINTFCINTNEIVYLEANNKYCFIHLKNNTILCKKTMARVFEGLPKLHFQKINRAFIVNFDAINKYNSENVALKNGETLRITRTYFKNFKRTYREYSLPKII
ncbi:MAG: response regulator transcription factor [Clostridia bacterium]|nr:response regulator transcription factor [Clostridia bacterium]